jgi:hypothetical protein
LNQFCPGNSTVTRLIFRARVMPLFFFNGSSLVLASDLAAAGV